ncbi:MAG: riboflavin biosynthesis protein RibF [Defluviitaleaceae bacterium]|nr:riboflavin biosynthesis protein RibF [Defluviitaleaceae bacterium]
MVLTIGKFEGIHLGHRALLREVVARAGSLGLQSAVIVFKPHPFVVLADEDYKPIFSEQERERLIKSNGIQRIITLDFREIVTMNAQDFCQKLFTEYGTKEIIVGEDYRFGNNREGTLRTLQQAAARHNAAVRTIAKINNISTSRIRELLAQQNFCEAEKLLGFPFFIEGIVTKGRQLGGKLGFPTLNIYPPSDKFLPPRGVYTTRTIIDGAEMAGLTNIGVCPTVNANEDERLSVETHVPSLQAGELYGQKIRVEFLRFIRPEKRFGGIEELKAQISEDLRYLLTHM